MLRVVCLALLGAVAFASHAANVCPGHTDLMNLIPESFNLVPDKPAAGDILTISFNGTNNATNPTWDWRHEDLNVNVAYALYGVEMGNQDFHLCGLEGNTHWLHVPCPLLPGKPFYSFVNYEIPEMAMAGMTVQMTFLFTSKVTGKEYSCVNTDVTIGHSKSHTISSITSGLGHLFGGSGIGAANGALAAPAAAETLPFEPRFGKEKSPHGCDHTANEGWCHALGKCVNPFTLTDPALTSKPYACAKPTFTDLLMPGIAMPQLRGGQ